MSDLVTTLVTSGAVASVLGAAIGAVANRRGRSLKKADYAEIATRMSREIADDLREDNVELSKKVDTLQSSLDTLRGRVDVLTDALWAAIRHLEKVGEDASKLRRIVNGHEL